MKLGTQDVKLAIGDVEVSKAYLNGVEVYTKPSGGDENLLPGFTYLDLPLDLFDLVEPHVYEPKPESGANLKDLPLALLGDGYFMYKYIGGRVNDFYLSGGGVNLDFYINGDVTTYVSGGSDNPIEPPVVGTYYGYKKVSNLVQLVKTTDGVTFTVMHEFGTYAHTELKVWQQINLYFDNIYYLQGIGVTNTA